MVVEGTSTRALRRAAGHIPAPECREFRATSALPRTATRSSGRCGTYGRMTSSRSLQPAAEYRYRVVSTKVVDPGDVSVLNASDDEILTLVTCYPFFFVGSAPERFVVRAERII